MALRKNNKYRYNRLIRGEQNKVPYKIVKETAKRPSNYANAFQRELSLADIKGTITDERFWQILREHNQHQNQHQYQHQHQHQQ